MREPSYGILCRKGILQKRVDQAREIMRACRLCPHECGVDRLSGERGICRTGRRATVASFHAHFGEEAPLVGRCGSGTIFISSCNLFCTFCQNYEISHGGEGVEVVPAQMAAMMLELARSGCHNINVVTPSHVVPQILEGLVIAAEQGLDVPLVYNSGGYDSVETLQILDGIVDMYMPDFKFCDPQQAGRFCRAADYREQAVEAIREMHRQVGDLEINSDGIAVRGLLVRHLVMPDDMAGTAEVMRFLADEISVDTYVNIMDQYRPCYRAKEEPLINRPVTREEFSRAVAAAEAAGLHRLDPGHALPSERFCNGGLKNEE